MTYTATISSKGQITIPIEARRKLGLGKKVILSLEADRLIIKQPLTMEDAWAIMYAPSGKLVIDKDKSAWAKAAISKDKIKRGY